SLGSHLCDLLFCLSVFHSSAAPFSYSLSLHDALPILQIFLQEQALDLMERNLVRTRLFFDESQNLIGFYSLFNDTIKIHKNKREEINIHLPHGVKEIPAVRLHYIGVDDRYKGQGYGDILMSSVLVNCIKIAQISGCPLITVESSESAREFYERY